MLTSTPPAIPWAEAAWYQPIGAWLDVHPISAALLGLTFLLVLAWLVAFVARRIILSVVTAIARRSPTAWDDVMLEEGVFHRLTWLLPLLVIYRGIPLVPALPGALEGFFQRLVLATMVVAAVRTASAVLASANAIYNRYPMASYRPIKTYVQVGTILLHILGLVFVVAVLIDQSPWFFVSGLGAMTAIILLIFRDTLLSLVAGIQLTNNNVVRVGDWIEMPQFRADGDVIDIALHTVKVQNWDRTITVIPTHMFLEHSFKNWRGMTESGGRRIMRAIHVDMETIRFLTDEEIQRFGRFQLLREYIRGKIQEIDEFNRTHDLSPGQDVTARRLTNIGTFQAYIASYLRHHPNIKQDMILMVRQLAPSPDGLPLEVYAFTNDTAWTRYEEIQAAIFDHLLAVVPEFGLRVFQRPSGNDVQRALSSVSALSV